MAFQVPQSRSLRTIQTTKRNIPLDQIIAVEGANPLATGIEAAGGVIGNVLAKRAQLQQQGQQLAKLESLGGLGEGSLSGLDPSTASSFAAAGMKQNADIKEEARKLAQNTQKVRALEKEFQYKPGELGDDHPAALLKVQNDLAMKKINEGPGAQKAEAQEKNRYRNYLLDMEQKDPVIKEINKQGLNLAAVDSLQNLVKSGNTVAFSGLGIKMAKGMGEVGVMTEQDIKRYVQSGAIGQKAADTLSTWLKGKPTEATLGEIGDITTALRTAYQEKAQPRYDQYINAYSNIEGIPPDVFAKKLGLSFGSGQKSPGLQKVTPTSPPLIKPPLSPLAQKLLEKHK